MFLAPVAVHLLLLCDGKVLMLRRYNTGYQDGNYSVIAGHIDGGEELKAAMIREAREEAGIGISPENLTVVGVIDLIEDDEYVSFFLHASKYSGEVANMEPDKCDDLSWFDIDDIPPNTIPYVRRAIQNYRDGIWFDTLGWK